MKATDAPVYRCPLHGYVSIREIGTALPIGARDTLVLCLVPFPNSDAPCLREVEEAHA